jgi:sulfotransferase family protein
VIAPGVSLSASSGSPVVPSSERNPYVFVVGCPRSGTSVLRRMLGANPSLAMFTRETHWIPRCFHQRIGVTPAGEVTGELISWLAADKRFPSMGIGRDELEALLENERPLRLPYARFVSLVFDLYAAKAGKSFAGDKTPVYARELPTLHALFPRARFVHIIRDGRDVALSLLAWAKSPRIVGRRLPWSEDPVACAALHWEWHVRLAREAGKALGPDLYHEVRYERLVSAPTESLAPLCAFLEIPHSERMLLEGESRKKVHPGLDAKHLRLPPTPGLRDWRSEMQADHLERFEGIAGELLTELGYPRAFPRPSTAVRDHARRFRELYAQRLERPKEVTADA